MADCTHCRVQRLRSAIAAVSSGLAASRSAATGEYSITADEPAHQPATISSEVTTPTMLAAPPRTAAAATATTTTVPRPQTIGRNRGATTSMDAQINPVQAVT